MARPVAARQPPIRWGRYWNFFSITAMQGQTTDVAPAMKLDQNV